MRRLLKWLWRIPLILIGLVIVVGIASFFYLQGSVPDYDDSVRVANIDAPIQIMRDTRAIPHIFAANEEDAAFALGYVHAQDRLWQMDMQRRIGQGRLAELIGASALPIDRFMRTIGAYRLAEASFDRLDPDMQASLSAYADGVNAYVDQHSGAWPPEFYALWYAFEPWQPADTLVWGRLLDIQLSNNWGAELARAAMDEILPAGQVDMLIPPGPGETVTLADVLEMGIPGGDMRRLLAAMPPPLGPGGASNQWVVDGEHTETGAPMLANDPHLSLEAPSIWYLARIETPGLKLVGATIPGVPVLVLGHNGHVAWGFTTAYTDAQDLFLEQIDPDDPGRYLTPDGSVPFDSREEIIQVRMGDDVSITIRETRHGPVISDIDEEAAAAAGEGYVMALAATGFVEDDIIATSMYGMNRAPDAASFITALEDWISPQQNVAFADSDGTIGFVTVGHIPDRGGRTGYRPVEGWTGDNDWQGMIAFDDMPQTLNPADGIIINANNASVGADYPYFLGFDNIGDDRAIRIEQMLDPVDRDGPLALGDNETFQADALSLPAQRLTPLLLDAVAQDAGAEEVASLLAEWDHRMDRDRPEPLIYSAWMRELTRGLFAPRLGELFEGYWGLHPTQVAEILTSRPDWCDDPSSDTTETCDDQVRSALDRALDWITERHGEDPTAWRWGDEHFAAFPHQLFSRIPGVSALVDLAIPTDGSEYTVNRAGTRIANPANPFVDSHGPGFRAVYDLSNLDNSLFGMAPGQSGNPFSPHYGDLRESWRDVELFPIAGDPEELRRTGLGTTTLRPAE